MAGVWTRNLDGFIRAKALGYAAPGYATVYDRDGNVVSSTAPGNMYSDGTLSATEIPALQVYTATGTPADNSVLSANSRYLGIRFGAGSTAPTVNDHALASDITTSLNVVAVSNGTYNLSNGVASRTIRITVQNQGSQSRTIAEWGIEGLLRYDTSSSGGHNWYYRYILLYRDVLDTPVTLAQYESATFTVTLELTLAAES